jgi:uncharacterized SAM-binding protein YcdF (DUF218 family)
MHKLIKILKYFGVGVMALLLLDAGLVFGFAIKSSNIQKADAIIIMGAAINSPALYNRSLTALTLYEQNLAPVLVLSGGRISDKDISEATYMQRVLQSKATKPLNVMLDEQASNTLENIKNSKNQLPEAKSIIIITDKFHLARSVITAKFLGYEAVFWDAPKGEYYPKSGWAFYYLREMVALPYYVGKFAFGRF